jgi:hypothetical protein
MNDAPRFQYSLRTLLIIMTVSAVLMGFLKMMPPYVLVAVFAYLFIPLVLLVIYICFLLFVIVTSLFGGRTESAEEATTTGEDSHEAHEGDNFVI